MYVLHFNTKISNIQGQNCISLCNKTGQELKIAKVEVSSTHQVEVALLQGKAEISNEDLDISEIVRTTKVGEIADIAVDVYREATLLNPVTTLKSASIQDGTQRKLIDSSDYLILGTNEDITVRAVPTLPFQTIHITILFDEIK